MENQYTAIAPVYDRFNKTLSYQKLADYIERQFQNFLPEKPKLVLDLACGTGKLSRELARRGYDMTAVDASEDMLSVAQNQKGSEGILYLLQDMTSFELYGTVGAVVCAMDSLNYLLEDGELDKCFSLVHNYLDPDGLFLFDMNAPYKFSHDYGKNAYIMEEEQGKKKQAVYLGWQNEYDAKTRLCDFLLTLFEENTDGTYTRRDEWQTERCYSYEEITCALRKNGFEILGVYADLKGKAPTKRTKRWYFAARAKK